MMRSEFLLESDSPNGNLKAFVEQDSRVAYLYVQGKPETGLQTGACWVRNLVPAPEAPDIESMKAGRAPMLHASACRDPRAGKPLVAGQLSLVWSEEGDSVFLLEEGCFLAAIPGWSWAPEFVAQGFRGYARDCVEETRLCWPLSPEGEVRVRAEFERFQECWASWERNPWPEVQKRILDVYESSFGTETKYFAIDGGEWPPRFLARFDTREAVVFLTGGMCLRPMPRVDSYADDPGPIRRIELGFAIAAGSKFEESQVAHAMSGIAQYPWSKYSWLGEGHTTDWHGFGKTSEFTGVLLSRRSKGVPQLRLPAYRDDPVSVLWLMPITSPERELARGTGSEGLLRRLEAAGFNWVHKQRCSVV